MAAKRRMKARKARHLMNVAAIPNIPPMTASRLPQKSRRWRTTCGPPGCALGRKNKFRSSLTPYAMSPSFWLGADPQRLWSETGTNAIAVTLRSIHKFLWQLTVPVAHESDDANETEIEGVDFFTRALVLQALRRAVLRETPARLVSCPKTATSTNPAGANASSRRDSLTIFPISTKAWPSALSCFWKT